MTKEDNQKIVFLIFYLVLEYLRGLVIAIYRSRDIIHKFRIEAVHNKISTVAQMRQSIFPKGQLCRYNKSINANGMTITPTQRSAVANEVNNMFVNVLIRLYKQTDNTTKTLPNIVISIKIIWKKSCKSRNVKENILKIKQQKCHLTPNINLALLECLLKYYFVHSCWLVWKMTPENLLSQILLIKKLMYRQNPRIHRLARRFSASCCNTSLL